MDALREKRYPNLCTVEGQRASEQVTCQFETIIVALLPFTTLPPFLSWNSSL
jgi:hypothetical protein